MKNLHRETYYEWDIETIDPETGDVIDHDHRNTLADCFRALSDENTAIVLVMTWHDYDKDTSGRGWAYFDKEDLELEEYFSNGSKVPKKFLDEVKKSKK